jgi:hypothetical protein
MSRMEKIGEMFFEKLNDTRRCPERAQELSLPRSGRYTDS